MGVYRWLLPYGVAIGTTTLTLLLSLWLEALITRRIGAFFYMAVSVSTWYGGLGPGLTTVVLSTLAIYQFFVLPLQQPHLHDILQVALFVIVSLIINLLSANLKESKRQIEHLSRRLLDESTDRLKLALNAAQMGLWGWNRATGDMECSIECQQLLGFPLGQFDGRYETFLRSLHPADRTGVDQAMAASLGDRSPYCHEFRVVWPDGSVHWLEGRGQALHNPLGEAVQMSGTIMAIDQRKQVEATLRERESLLRLFFQYTPADIAMFDREMRYVMASQRWADEYHLGAVELLINRCHYDLFPEVPQRWREIHQRCLAGAIERCDEELFVRADGTAQWVSWEIHPWKTAAGEIGGIIIFAANITQRKQAENAWRQSEARLRLAQSASHSAVWDWDIAAQRVTWSPEYYELYGLEPTITPNYENWLRCIHPADRERVNWEMMHAMQNAVSNLRVEFRVLRFKEVRWFAGIGQIFYDAAGKALRMIGITIDVTLQKLTEIELQQLNLDLERRVAERTAELTMINEQLQRTLLEQQAAQAQVQTLERLNQMKDDFLSTVSHELRTPMTNIKMATQMLSIHLDRLGLLGHEPTPIQRYFNVLREEGQREIALINNLLDLTRLDGSTEPLTLVEVDLQTCLPRIAEVFVTRTQQQQQHFVLRLSPNLPSLMTHLPYLERILAELLNNACKYTPIGETITLSAQAMSDSLEICVKNSGVTIPPGERDRIFDKFYRIPKNDPWKHGGTGLGLALVKKLTNQLNGTIRVESGTGETAFVLEFQVPY